MERLRDYDHFIDKRGLLFNVKGPHHREGKVRSSLIYIPMPFPTGKQHVETGIHYARLIDDIGNVFCARNVNEVYYQDPITADSFVAVPVADIEKYYGVLEEKDRVMKLFEADHPVFKVLNKIKNMGISEASLGFFGTALARVLNRQRGTDFISDVDIVIYGVDNYRKWLEVYEEALKDWLIWPGMSRNRYRDFSGNFPFSFEEATKQFGERRCPYKLRLGDVKFDIRFAYTDGEEPPEERFSPMKEIKTSGTIVESVNSGCCPAVYKIESDKEGLVRILTYRHHYRHLFNKGEDVTVFGMLTSNPQKTITLERHDYYIKDSSLFDYYD